jgi:hypothetical protein
MEAVDSIASRHKLPLGVPTKIHEFWSTVWKLTNAANMQTFANIITVGVYNAVAACQQRRS